MGVCKPLMPDVVASKAQSQLCELSGSTFEFNTQEFSMVGGYTEKLEKPQHCQNWGWVLARDNTVHVETGNGNGTGNRNGNACLRCYSPI